MALIGWCSCGKLSSINIVEDKDSGEPRLSHRIDISTGMYNGRQVLKQKKNKE